MSAELLDADLRIFHGFQRKSLPSTTSKAAGGSCLLRKATPWAAEGSYEEGAMRAQTPTLLCFGLGTCIWKGFAFTFSPGSTQGDGNLESTWTETGDRQGHQGMRQHCCKDKV